MGMLAQYANTAWFRGVYVNRWTRLNTRKQLLKMLKTKKEKQLINTLYVLAFPGTSEFLFSRNVKIMMIIS
jgi:hypothetical protein